MAKAAAPARVLVVGDANVDLVLRGDVVPRFGQAEQLLDQADLTLGGSASIVACGLARLGVPTSLVARVGADAFGDVTLAALRAAGVDVTHVQVDPQVPTGVSVILSAPDDRAILTRLGTIPTLDAETVLAAAAVLAPAHVHVASYFLQPGLAGELPRLLAAVRAAGATTSLDTNWDPSERWAGVAEVLPHLDWLLPNLAELLAIAGAAVRAGGAGQAGGEAQAGVKPGAAEAAARSLAVLGPRVVVKAGAEGGWSVGADGERAAAPGLAVDVVDTTGAGDSFDAGYLASVAYGVADERERLRWATAAGSVSTLGAGGTGHQADLAELRARLA